jgi:Tfp pilus assembly major pilin PilA
MLVTYQQILQGETIYFRDRPEHIELILSGLLVNQNGILTIKNPIYQSVFDGNWIRQKLADRCPYREALHKWLASHKQDASRLLRGQALQEAKNWALGKELSSNDYQFIAASEQQEKQEIQTNIEANRVQELEKKLALESQQRRQEKQTANRQLIAIALLSLAIVTWLWQLK